MANWLPGLECERLLRKFVKCSVVRGRALSVKRPLDAQVSVDTACSSALVGSHMALQHLHSHRGSALSAGINLMLAEHTTAATQVAGMLSGEGRCKTLDAAADGYVRAEACLVMRLDAVPAGEAAGYGRHIIRATAVNQVGEFSYVPCR